MAKPINIGIESIYLFASKENYGSIINNYSMRNPKIINKPVILSFYIESYWIQCCCFLSYYNNDISVS